MHEQYGNDTNTNCINCENCIGCINCINCKNCVGCVDSSDCDGCISCKNCHECKESNNSSNCKGCIKCVDCQGCNNCIGCEQLVSAISKFWKHPFMDAKHIFPQRGCCKYNPALEYFLIAQRFEQYDDYTNLNKQDKIIAWNYGRRYKTYWIAKVSKRKEYDIGSLLNYIVSNKLYYNHESEVSIETILNKALKNNNR